MLHIMSVRALRYGSRAARSPLTGWFNRRSSPRASTCWLLRRRSKSALVELEDALSASGFWVETITPRPLHMDFAVWTHRTNVLPEMVAMLLQLQWGAGRVVCEQLAIADDGSFDLKAVTFTGAAR